MEIKKIIVGTWEIVDMYFQVPVTKEIIARPMGEKPIGLLIYTNEGFMSAQLGSVERKNFVNPDYRFGTKDEIFDAFNAYIAYSGQYSIYEAKNMIVHKVQVSMFPNWIGQQVKRYYQVNEEENGLYLYLRATEILHSNQLVIPTIKWKKLEC